jgi:hypothetical protein
LSAGDWSLKVRNEEHNHEMTQTFQDRKYFERPRPEENRLILELTTSMVLPRNIMTTLHNRNGRSAITIKHI